MNVTKGRGVGHLRSDKQARSLSAVFESLEVTTTLRIYRTDELKILNLVLSCLVNY
jgi:hypothetical protein